MKDINGNCKLLSNFKRKIEESVSLVPMMVAEEKLKAALFWNKCSKTLQEIVNKSAADISAVAFMLEEEIFSKAPNGKDTTMLESPDQKLQVPQHPIAEGNSSDMLVPHSHTIRTFGISSRIHKSSTIKLAQHELVGLTPNCPNRLLPSFRLNFQTHNPLPSQALAALSIRDQNANTEGNLRPLENPMVQIGDESRMFGADNVAQTNKGLRLGEISTNIPASNTGSQDRKKAEFEKSGAMEKENVLKCEDVNSVNTTSEGMQQQFSSRAPGDPTRRAMRTCRWNHYMDLSSFDTEESAMSSDNDSTAVDEDKSGNEEIRLTNTGKRRNGKSELYECPRSHSKLSTKGNLKAHSGERPYKCPQCHSKFSTKGSLKTHMKTHNGERPYKCPQCHSKFSTKGILKTHMNTHSGERPYKCPQCHSKFSIKGNLMVHMRTHSGERPFKCPQCYSKFSTKGNLKVHMRTHSGERPFKCPQCHSKFSTKGILKAHMKTHKGKRPYKCPQCHSKFLTNGNLKTHMKTHLSAVPFQILDQRRLRSSCNDPRQRELSTHVCSATQSSQPDSS